MKTSLIISTEMLVCNSKLLIWKRVERLLFLCGYILHLLLSLLKMPLNCNLQFTISSLLRQPFFPSTTQSYTFTLSHFFPNIFSLICAFLPLPFSQNRKICVRVQRKVTEILLESTHAFVIDKNKWQALVIFARGELMIAGKSKQENLSKS